MTEIFSFSMLHDKQLLRRPELQDAISEISIGKETSILEPVQQFECVITTSNHSSVSIQSFHKTHTK